MNCVENKDQAVLMALSHNTKQAERVQAQFDMLIAIICPEESTEQILEQSKSNPVLILWLFLMPEVRMIIYNAKLS